MSARRHWSDDDLISRLYGVGPGDDHLDTCPECARRWEILERRRARLLASAPAVPDGLFLAERRAIRMRLGAPKRKWRFDTVSTVASAVLLTLVVLMMFQPGPKPQPTDAADAKLFEEVFDLVASPEPSAVEPVRSLFEVRQ